MNEDRSMIKILSIGNSFSQDAQRYLHQIAENEGEIIQCVGLYIGGCALHLHHEYLLTGHTYEVERNGVGGTGEMSDIITALKSEKWDYVTLQQVSHLAPKWESYQPHLSVLAEAVREYAPRAKILIHQTWAYEEGSQRLTAELGYADQHDMLADVIACYDRAAKEIDAYGIIKSGEAMMKTIESGVKVHRDTFHAGLGLGRYLLGLVWYMTLTGRKIKNGFIRLHEPAEIGDLEKAKAAAEKVVFGE